MLKNRFLSVFVLAFAAGIAMPFLLGTGMEAVAFLICVCLAVPALGVAAAVFWLCKKGKNVLLYMAFAGFGFCLGAGWLWIRSVPYNAYAAYEGREDVIEGVVTESGSSIESSYLELEVERSYISLPAGTKIRLYGASSGYIRIGDYIRAACTYSKRSQPSYRATSVALIANGTVVSHTPDESILNSFRNTLLDACEDLYKPYDSVGVAQALALRERSLLSPETSDGYRNAGVAHLLAISGLHLSILVALLRRFLRVFKFRKITRECIALGIILLYCFLTGFSPSIVRASVMLGFVLLGELFLDETDSITVLFFALLLLLAVNPYSLLSAGLQLSFLSCLGILLLEPYITDLQKRLRGDSKAKHMRMRKMLASLAGMCLISCGAVIFTFPVTVASFGNISYLSPITNLIFIPLFTPILALLLLSVLVFPLLPVLAQWIAFLPGAAFAGMNWLFSQLLQAEIGSLDLDGMWFAVPVLLSVLAITCMLVFVKKAIPLFLAFSGGAMLSVVLLLCIPFAQSSSLLTVSYAEGYVYLSKEESAAFLDLGGIPAGGPVVFAPLDAYLVSQATEESRNRLQGILQHTTIESLYLPLTDASGRGNDLTDFYTLARMHGCTVHEYRYVAQTDLFCFYAKEGRIETVFRIGILLSGDVIPREDRQYVLLPDFSGQIPAQEGHTFYVPTLFQGTIHPQGTIRYYTDSITFQDREVTAS